MGIEVVEISSSSNDELGDRNEIDEINAEIQAINIRSVSNGDSSEYEGSSDVENTWLNESLENIPENLGVRSLASTNVARNACESCLFFRKMHQHARVYYNAGALKLELAKKNNKRAIRKRHQPEKYYEAANRKLQRAYDRETDIEKLAPGRRIRKAAMKAREALREINSRANH